jgi:hypothetical protein
MKLPAFLVLSALAAAFPASAQESGSAMLVLDASGSMWGQIDGRTKIELARDAVAGLLEDWQPGMSLGLMAYGHRRKGDCADIEVLREADGFNAAALRAQVNALSPKGMTPITASVREAAARLRFEERKATVILVSDGEETCNADPCALGRELEELGVDFTAHVVGFDIQDGSAAHRQLQCLAESTGGRYVRAGDGRSLVEALQSVAVAEPPPAAPDPAILAREGQEWMPGFALEPDLDVTLDKNAGATVGLDFEVGQPAEDCKAQCDASATCKGWHFEPTGSFFVGHPRCRLFGGGFAVRLKPEGSDWVAGIKPGEKLILVEESGE